ncbi:MAG TPA: NAD(P)H-dependent glycerol-3-phosphate dehydrogenase [Candidatus Methylomirabilis sp.]|nr:NAD(P)H-dependent glycerol-3-phosphate dehydrogenase [Candidatus Methylomirabilis sp.]
MTAATKPAVTVLGAGSWGTALALLLARNGHTALLWGSDAARQARLEHERQNSAYLPGMPFPANLHVRDSLAEAAKASSRFLIAVPSRAFRTTLTVLQPLLTADAVLACATKGLEPGSGKLLSEVALESLGAERSLAVVSGPTFAREVALNMPSALTVASDNVNVAREVASWLRNERVRVYTSGDVAGVQLGAAIKNVMAIAAGISDGLGFGANARAALITRGLAELTRLGVAMGGKSETFMGLTGAGDLILTCTDDSSRNRRVGLALGRGQKLPEILAALGQEAEGVATARELYQLAKKLEVDMPITEQVYRVLYENLAPHAAVEALLRREPRQENH